MITVSARAFIVCSPIAVAIYLMHEAAHWIVGAALGYDMSYGTNSVIPGSAMTARDHILMSAAGPALNTLTGLVAFVLALRRQSLTAYAALYSALFMRVIEAWKVNVWAFVVSSLVVTAVVGIDTVRRGTI